MKILILAAVLATAYGYSPECLTQSKTGQVVQLPHPADCRKFYKCSTDNVLTEQHCPAYLEYNPIMKVCDWPTGFCYQKTSRTAQSVFNCTNEKAPFRANYEDNCQTYFQCVGGNSLHLSCKENYRFDPLTNKCIHAEKVNCVPPKGPVSTTRSVGPSFCDKKKDGTMLGHPEECDMFYLCYLFFDVEQICWRGRFDKNTGTCIPEDGSCNPLKLGPEPNLCANCADGVILPHAKCDKYYVCQKQIAKEETCTAGKRFDKKTKKCVADDGSCNPVNPCANCADGVILPHAKCDKYYVCQKQIAKEETCTAGKRFDKKTKKCVADDGSCNPVNPCTGSVDGVRLPHVECNKYYVCEKQVAKEETCTAGKRYDKTQKKCIDDDGSCKPVNNPCANSIDGAFQPHVKCNMFYVCDKKRATEQTCSDGLMFDKNKKQCTVNDGSCEINNPCANSIDGAFQPHAVCNMFYVCQNKQATTQSCDKGLMFDKNVKACIRDDGTCKQDDIKGPCTGKSDGTKVTQPGEACGAYYICDKDGNLGPKQSCANARRFNPSTQSCVLDRTCSNQALVSKNDPCFGRKTGSLVKHDTDCSKFYSCSNGIVATEQFCPNGKRFDDALQVCVNDNGTCKRCAGRLNGAAIPHPNDCNLFVTCENGKETIGSCGAGRKFDGKIGVCIVDTLNQCEVSCANMPEGTLLRGDSCYKYFACINGQRSAPLFCRVGTYFDGTGCVEDTKKQCRSFDKECLDEPFGGLVKSSEDCAAYHRCINFIKTDAIACLIGDKFDEKAKKCVKDFGNVCYNRCKGKRNGTPLAHSTQSCFKFTVCQEGREITHSCQPGMKFDTSRMLCVADVGNQCRDLVCTNKHDGFKKVSEDDCTLFYTCVNQKKFLSSCEFGDYFNDTEKKCFKDLNRQCYTSCRGKPTGSYQLISNQCSNHFLHCEKGRANIRSCGPNMVMDTSRNICVRGNCPHFSSCQFNTTGELSADPRNCHNFFLCLGDSASEQTCPTNEYFDVKEGQCLSGLCSPNNPECTNVADNTLLPSHTTNSEFFVCSYGHKITKRCKPGFIYDAKKFQCVAPLLVGKDHVFQTQIYFNVTSNASRYPQPRIVVEDILRSESTPCWNKHFDMVPHESVCNRYYLCVSGTSIEMSCGDGLQFDSSSGKCEIDSNKQCSVTNRNTTEVSCVGKTQGAYMSHADDCSSYYVCSNGFPIYKQCAKGFAFDGKMRICVPDVGNQCGRNPADLEVSISGEPDPSVCQGKHGTFIPSQTNCNEFYVCIYSALKRERCFENEYFEKRLNRCVRNETQQCADKKTVGCKVKGELIPDQKDCRQFYECDSKLVGKIQRCRNGQSFDSILGFCRQSDGTCLLENGERVGACANKHGRNTHGEACNSYFACMNGQKIEKTCSHGYVYAEGVEKCVQDVNGRCNLDDHTVGNSTLPSCAGLVDSLFYPNTEDRCRTFFKCESGEAQLFDCPTGELFNAITRSCENANITTCSKANFGGFENKICDNTIKGIRYVKPGNGCKSFYSCHNGIVEETDCGDGLLYNPYSDACEEADKFVCPTIET